MRTLLAVALTLLALGRAEAEGARALPLAGAPLEVVTYATEYDVEKEKPLVGHTVKYRNTSDKEVVAAKFGFVELDVFGDLLDAFMGYTVESSDPGEKDSAEFVNEHPRAVFFEELGTGLVWVEAVRFADGSIWKADRAEVLEGVRRVRPDAGADDLREKKSVAAQ